MTFYIPCKSYQSCEFNDQNFVNGISYQKYDQNKNLAIKNTESGSNRCIQAFPLNFDDEDEQIQSFKIKVVDKGPDGCVLIGIAQKQENTQ